jgi:hypothetical protein
VANPSGLQHKNVTVGHGAGASKQREINDQTSKGAIFNELEDAEILKVWNLSLKL